MHRFRREQLCYTMGEEKANEKWMKRKEKEQKAIFFHFRLCFAVCRVFDLTF